MGELAFQEYFVRLACEPEVRGFTFKDVEEALPAPGVSQAIQEADLVVICPSNPWVSIDPILAVPGIREELQKKVVLAISPLIGGKAVKGPAAKMYREMGLDPTAATVAKHYGDLLTGFIMDNKDRELAHRISETGTRIFTTDSLMNDRQDRVVLAENVIDFGLLILKEEK
jgi:LPPG:FO 2-phospho-L-lactate transferase